VDASTAAAPLQTLIACKLLGFRYSWGQSFIDGTYTIYPNFEDILADFDYWERINSLCYTLYYYNAQKDAKQQNILLL
jgi:hypothetical protein